MMDRHKCDRAKTTIDTAHNLMHLACQPLVCKPPTCPCDETNTPTYYITKSCAQIVIEENKLYLISLKAQYDCISSRIGSRAYTQEHLCELAQQFVRARLSPATLGAFPGTSQRPATFAGSLWSCQAGQPPTWPTYSKSIVRKSPKTLFYNQLSPKHRKSLGSMYGKWVIPFLTRRQ